MELRDLRRKLDALKSEASLIDKQIGQERGRLESLQTDGEDIAKARALIQEAALRTQEALRLHLTAVTTTALRAVFPDQDLSFEVTFETKRGRTEAVLEVVEGESRADVMDGYGGGVVDVVSLSLRAAFWSISRTRPVLIMDEPMKFLSSALRPLGADMLRMLADKLGLQIIMVSHLPEMEAVADLVVGVERRAPDSTVRVLRSPVPEPEPVPPPPKPKRRGGMKPVLV